MDKNRVVGILEQMLKVELPGQGQRQRKALGTVTIVLNGHCPFPLLTASSFPEGIAAVEWLNK